MYLDTWLRSSTGTTRRGFESVRRLASLLSGIRVRLRTSIFGVTPASGTTKRKVKCSMVDVLSITETDWEKRSMEWRI